MGELLRPDDTRIEITLQPAPGLQQSIYQTSWAQYSPEIIDGVLTIKMNPAHIPALNKWLVVQGIEVSGITTQHSFEAYFLNITHETTAADRTV